jgi:hypothetical protein
MQPAPVHEHRGEERDPVVAGDDIGRRRSPAQHEFIAAGQFEVKENGIERHERWSRSENVSDAVKRPTVEPIRA